MRDGNSGHGDLQVGPIGTSEIKKNSSFKLADHGNHFALDVTFEQIGEQVGGHETSRHDKRSQVIRFEQDVVGVGGVGAHKQDVVELGGVGAHVQEQEQEQEQHVQEQEQKRVDVVQVV